MDICVKLWRRHLPLHSSSHFDNRHAPAGPPCRCAPGLLWEHFWSQRSPVDITHPAHTCAPAHPASCVCAGAERHLACHINAATRSGWLRSKAGSRRRAPCARWRRRVYFLHRGWCSYPRWQQNRSAQKPARAKRHPPLLDSVYIQDTPSPAGGKFLGVWDTS